MQFSVPHLFEHFLSNSPQIPIELEHLQQSLNLTEPDQQVELQIALDGLVRIGFIEQVPHTSQYRRRTNDSLVIGRLRCSSKGFCFAIRDEPGVEDVYIHGTNLQGAWNGDQVIARITKDGKRNRSPEGEVAAVIERANPTIVGQLKHQGSNHFKAAPLDDRLLFELEILQPNDPSAGLALADQANPSAPGVLAALEQEDLDPGVGAETLVPEDDGKYAYIEIHRYPLANLPPLGIVRKILGNTPDASIDVDLVCCKYDLPQSFPESVFEAASVLPTQIDRLELKKRHDLQAEVVLTLEPMDLQHPHGMEPSVGISLQAQMDGSWQLGVHIADVAHWIGVDTILDWEAQQRSKAAYLDATVLPLFPPTVQNLCALLPQKERLTLSVLMKLAPDGRLQGYEIYPSVIRSRAHLSYGQVEALLATAEETEATSEDAIPELMALLQNLYHLSQLVRQQRHQQGGFDFPMLELDSPQSADESREGALVISPTSKAHMLMTEFTLLTNRAIGEHLRQLNIAALCQIQPTPSVDEMQGFLRLIGNMRLDLNLADSSEVTLADFQRFCAWITTPDLVAQGVSPALVSQLLSTLPEAVYQVSPLSDVSLDFELEDQEVTVEPVRMIRHFGLGLSAPYCHITAPLRRYADLMNQRALHLLFEKGRDRRTSRVKQGVDLHSSSCHGRINWYVLPPKTQEEWQEILLSQVAGLNQRYRIIQQAELELIGLKKSEFMQKHIGQVFPGLIIGVQNYGFFVMINPILAEGLVHVSSLNQDWYEYRSRQQALVGRKSRRQFRLGDRVEVEIKNVDYYRKQIDLVVVGDGRPYDDDDN